MRFFVYFLPTLLVVLASASIYYYQVSQAVKNGKTKPNFLNQKLVNILVLTMVVAIINFVAIFLILGNRGN